MLFFVLIKPYFINSCINETNYRNTTCIQYICSNKKRCRFIDTCDYCDSFYAYIYDFIYFKFYSFSYYIIIIY